MARLAGGFASLKSFSAGAWGCTKLELDYSMLWCSGFSCRALGRAPDMHTRWHWLQTDSLWPSVATTAV